MDPVFYKDVSLAMMARSQSPDKLVLISIENTNDECSLFWTSIIVQNTICSHFIVVRLNYVENLEEISMFEQFSPIESVPSLFLFAPDSNGISKKWDVFPTPKAFRAYLEASFSSIFPKEQLKPIQSEQKKQKAARIAVQLDSRTISREFSPQDTVKTLRSWISSEFGPEFDIISLPANKALINDEATLEEEGCVPSAKLLLRSRSIEVQNYVSTQNHKESFLGSVARFFDPWSGFNNKMSEE